MHSLFADDSDDDCNFSDGNYSDEIAAAASF